MPKYQTVIRPVSGGDGPFWVQSKKDDVDFNITLTVANLNAALDQAKTDQGGAIPGGESIKQVIITTETS